MRAPIRRFRPYTEPPALWRSHCDTSDGLALTLPSFVLLVTPVPSLPRSIKDG